MFELIATVCVAGACHEALVPGYEAESLTECQSLASGWQGTAQASCQPAGQALELTEIAAGIYVHIGQIAEPNPENMGDLANLGVIVGRDSVAVVDSGSTRKVGESLWRAVRQVTELPVRHLILTHMHPDHVLGASVFADAGPRSSDARGWRGPWRIVRTAICCAWAKNWGPIWLRGPSRLWWISRCPTACRSTWAGANWI